MTGTDGRIRRAVLERLAVESQWIDVSAIGVDVADGVVSLTGDVDDRADANGLAWALIRLTGVSGVAISGLRCRLGPDPHPTRNEGGWGAGGPR